MFLWWWKRKLKSNDYGERLKALEKLSRYQSPQAVRLLVGVMQGRSRFGDFERRRAIEGLGTIGHRQAIAPLVEELARGDSYAAKEALKRIDPGWASSPEARGLVPKLIEKLAEATRRNGSASALADCLLYIDDRRALPLFLQILQSQAPAVSALVDGVLKWGDLAQAVDAILAWMRRKSYALNPPDMAYVKALGTFRDRRAIGALVRVWAYGPQTVDRAPDLPRAAEQALNDIDLNWFQSPEARAAVPELVHVLAKYLHSSRHVDPVRELLTSIEPQWSQRPEARAQVGDAILAKATEELGLLERFGNSHTAKAQAQKIRPGIRSGGVPAIVRLAMDCALGAETRGALLSALRLDGLPVDGATRAALHDHLLNLLGEPEERLRERAAVILHGHVGTPDLPRLVAVTRRILGDPACAHRAVTHVGLIREVVERREPMDEGALRDILAMRDECVCQWTEEVSVNDDEYREKVERETVIDCRRIKELAATRLSQELQRRATEELRRQGKWPSKFPWA
jgi:HEAT repeat protein